jgi:superfamily II DNA or RNA helicase
MTLEKISGIFIPNTHSDYNQIKMDLDRFVTTFNGDYTRMIFYEESDAGIEIPRLYPVQDDILDNSMEGDTIELSSNIIPRTNRQQQAMDFLYNNNSGVLKLEPGAGKTIIAIHTICRIKKRTIIFVHKDSLIKQWKQEILDHTDLKEEDIGILKRKTYKGVFNKPIIISTVQSVGSFIKTIPEFKEEIRNAGIGIAIFDEAHTTVGPEKFSKCSMVLPCKRIYGLSATPYRTDGNDDIIKYHLGEIKYFEAEEGEALKPTVFMIYFPFGVYSQHKKYLSWGGKFSQSKYFQQLYKSPIYIDRVSKIINKLHSQNRILLVLGVRLTSLFALAKNINVEKNEVGILIPTAVKNKKYKKDIDDVTDTTDLTSAFNDKNIVFSTYTAARDGNNRKALDTLIMTVPTGNVEQAAGRILRVLEGKKQPYIIDLIDTEGPLVQSAITKTKVPWFIRSSLKRKEFYKEKGWEIKEFTYTK